MHIFKFFKNREWSNMNIYAFMIDFSLKILFCFVTYLAIRIAYGANIWKIKYTLLISLKREIQKQSLGAVLKNNFLERFREISLKTPATESFVSKVADLTPATVTKKGSILCFSANFAKSFWIFQST